MSKLDNKYKQAVHGLCPLQTGWELLEQGITLLSKFEIKMNFRVWINNKPVQVDVVSVVSQAHRSILVDLD